jgi:hypothetical protein
MDNLTIPIIEQNKVCSFFCKGNSHILNKHESKFTCVADDQKTMLFEDLWYQEFKCKLFKKDKKIYSHLIFENDNDVFLFFLKIK